MSVGKSSFTGINLVDEMPDKFCWF